MIARLMHKRLHTDASRYRVRWSEAIRENDAKLAYFSIFLYFWIAASISVKPYYQRIAHV